MNLSANSINGIYSKLRKFFFDYGFFSDPYRGRDPREGFPDPENKDVEYQLLKFHLSRVSQKRGKLDAPLLGPDYHLAESYWRFNFLVLMNERGDEAAQSVMYANLLEFISAFGPVGEPGPISREKRMAAGVLIDQQLNRIILWLERNSAKFRDPIEKAELRKIREE